MLDDIEQIVRKYKMNFWNKRKFTNMFISDGESTSYTFSFDKTRIYFSSQFYPAMYGMKLQRCSRAYGLLFSRRICVKV